MNKVKGIDGKCERCHEDIDEEWDQICDVDEWLGKFPPRYSTHHESCYYEAYNEVNQ